MILPFKSIPTDLREWTKWILSLETQGTLEITLTGFGTTVTGDIEWVRLGRRITLHAPEAITGTSNANTLTMTGLPESITPEVQKYALTPLIDNSDLVLGLGLMSGTTITFLDTSPFSSTGFTPTGTKGIPQGWEFAYVLDS